MHREGVDGTAAQSQYALKMRTEGEVELTSDPLHGQPLPQTTCGRTWTRIYPLAERWLLHSSHLDRRRE